MAASVNQHKLRIIREFMDIIVPDHIQCLTDYQHKMLHCTRPYLELFDLQNEDVYGKRLRDFKNKYADNLIQYLGPHMELLEQLRPKYLWALISLEFKSGRKTLWVEIQAIDEVGFRYILTEAHLSIINDIILHINRYINKQIPTKHTLFNKIKIEVSEFEECIIFLLALGKSFKEISLILSTVYSTPYTDQQIKRIVHNKYLDKFNLLTVNELVSAYLLNSRFSNAPSKIISALSSGILSIIVFDDYPSI